MRWQSDGFNPPELVTASFFNYRSKIDTVASFIAVEYFMLAQERMPIVSPTSSGSVGVHRHFGSASRQHNRYL